MAWCSHLSRPVNVVLIFFCCSFDAEAASQSDERNSGLPGELDSVPSEENLVGGSVHSEEVVAPVAVGKPVSVHISMLCSAHCFLMLICRAILMLFYNFLRAFSE